VSDPTPQLDELERLGERSDSRAMAMLVGLLSHPDANYRLSAARALGRSGLLSALPDLLRTLRDIDPAVRQAAAWSLGQLRDNLATSGLQAALNDPDPGVRRSVIWALGKVGGVGVRSDLEAVRRADPDGAVRRAADAALSSAGQPVVSQPKAKSAGKRPRQSAKRARWLLLSALMVVLGAAGVIAALVWQQPLGPSLVKTDGEGLAPPVIVPPASEMRPPLCGGPPMMMLLLVGIDSGDSGYEAGFTDVIRVARIDFSKPSALLLAIPRDLWVTVPGLSDYGISENRLKTAYPYGNHYEVPGGGMSLLAQTLYVNFGLSVDHYVAVDFQGFAQGIDAIGGIDLALPAPVGSPSDAASYFAAGVQHFDGQRALAYARIRPENTSDLRRIDRQTEVIMAVRDRVLTPEGVTGLPALASSLQAATRTDLSPSQMNSLICIGQKINRSDIIITTLDPNLYVSVTDSYGYERLLPDTDAIRRAIAAFMEGDNSGVSGQAAK